MDKAGRYLGQALLYALFFVPLVFMTHRPLHQHLPPDLAVLKLAVRHFRQIIGESIPVSAADSANPAANMQPA